MEEKDPNDNRLVDLLAIFGIMKDLKKNRNKKKKRLDEIEDEDTEEDE